MIKEEVLNKFINEVKNDIKLRESEEELKTLEKDIITIFEEYKAKQEELALIEKKLNNVAHKQGCLKHQIDICKSRKVS